MYATGMYYVCYWYVLCMLLVCIMYAIGTYYVSKISSELNIIRTTTFT